MNKADIIAIIIISIATGLGIYMGFIRGITTMIASLFAFQIAHKATNLTPTYFFTTFFGILIIGFVVGALIYGYTRTQPIEAFEGVFGAIFGLIVGWQIARFVFDYYFLFKPDSSLVQLIQSSAIGMDIYEVTPVKFILQALDGLMHPKVDSI